MTRKRNGWNPKPKTQMILNRAMEHIKSVPYPVSLRWLFYRLKDEGIYQKKKEYSKFKDICADARHNRWNGWEPDIIEDETRDIFWHGIGSFNESDAIEKIKCEYDKLQDQDNIVIILFEARAMHKQFKYYTKHIPLVPFGGDVSIPLKYETAMAVPRLIKRYNKPVVLLYFGDCDKKGNAIQKAAFMDIKRWCPVGYTLIIGGLTLQQAESFNLPPSIAKHGYQWESLTDAQAREIITMSLSKYHNSSRCKKYETMDTETLARWKEKIRSG